MSNPAKDSKYDHREQQLLLREQMLDLREKEMDLRQREFDLKQDLRERELDLKQKELDINTRDLTSSIKLREDTHDAKVAAFNDKVEAHELRVAAWVEREIMFQREMDRREWELQQYQQRHITLQLPQSNSTTTSTMTPGGNEIVLDTNNNSHQNSAIATTTNSSSSSPSSSSSFSIAHLPALQSLLDEKHTKTTTLATQLKMISNKVQARYDDTIRLQQQLNQDQQQLHQDQSQLHQDQHQFEKDKADFQIATQTHNDEISQIRSELDEQRHQLEEDMENKKKQVATFDDALTPLQRQYKSMCASSNCIKTERWREFLAKKEALGNKAALLGYVSDELDLDDHTFDQKYHPERLQLCLYLNLSPEARRDFLTMSEKKFKSFTAQSKIGILIGSIIANSVAIRRENHNHIWLQQSRDFMTDDFYTQSLNRMNNMTSRTLGVGEKLPTLFFSLKKI